MVVNKINRQIGIRGNVGDKLMLHKTGVKRWTGRTNRPGGAKSKRSNIPTPRKWKTRETYKRVVVSIVICHGQPTGSGAQV